VKVIVITVGSYLGVGIFAVEYLDSEDHDAGQAYL
jgi:hypothetical protein